MIRRWAEQPTQILNRLSPELTRRLVVVGVLLGAAWVGFGNAPIRMLMAGVLGLIGLGVAVEWPEWRLPGLITAAAFVPFSIGTGTESSINVVMLGVAGLFGLQLVEAALGNRLRLPPSPMNAPWIWMLLVSLLSLVAGEALRSPWLVTKSNFLLVQFAQFSLFLLAAAAFWLAAGDAAGERQIRRVISMMLGLGLLLVIFHLAPVSLFPITRRYLLVQPIFRICAVALAASLALFGEGYSRGYRIRAGLLALALVFVPFWRVNEWASGWLPGLFVLFTVCFLWLAYRNLRPALIFALILGMAGSVYIVDALASAEAWSLETRIMAWRSLGQLMPGHWILGLGLASYGHYWNAIIGVAQYLDPTTGYLHYTFTPQVNMHNNFLDILAQMGFLGLISFLWLLLVYLHHAWQAFRSSRSELSLILSVTSLSIVASIFIAGNLGDWLIPFVYNVGLAGFRDSFFAWMMLGLLVLSLRVDEEALANAEAALEPQRTAAGMAQQPVGAQRTGGGSASS